MDIFEENMEYVAAFNFILNIYSTLLWDWDEDEEMFCEKRNKIQRIENYVERIIPNFTSQQFQMHFRISRSAYDILIPLVSDELLQIYEQEMRSRNAGMKNCGRRRIDSEKQLLSVLWLLATPDSYRSVGERFNLGKSSLSECFFRIIIAITKLAPKVIKWPTAEEVLENQRKFSLKGGFNGVVGAIDGTYIPIKAPKKDPQSYITRKCTYAYTLQAICNADLKMIDCFVGYPGSVSDTRIFKNSDIYKDVMQNREEFFPNEDSFLIGDKAYPVLPWCIPPYIDRGNLTRQKTLFNRRHAAMRSVIERSFALLFGRFRRLKFLDMNKNEEIPAVVLAACVLHNICLDANDLLIADYVRDGMDGVDGNENFEDIHNCRNATTDWQLGHRKRDQLCQQMNQR